MQPISLFGFLAFFVASLTVGVRLLLLWRRTRQLPELLIGIGVLGIGPVGFGAMMIGHTLIAQGAPLTGLAPRVCFAIGYAMVFIGVTSKLVFNWRVYHPDVAWLRGVVALLSVVLCSIYLYFALVQRFIPAPKLDAVSLLQSGLQVAALLWGSFEALRYWRLMARRAAIGLADPVVMNRFLLWGIGAGAAGLGTGIGTVASYVTGVPSLQLPWVVMSSSAHGLIAAIAMSLAFLPPKSYLGFIAGKRTPASA